MSILDTLRSLRRGNQSSSDKMLNEDGFSIVGQDAVYLSGRGYEGETDVVRVKLPYAFSELEKYTGVPVDDQMYAVVGDAGGRLACLDLEIEQGPNRKISPLMNATIHMGPGSFSDAYSRFKDLRTGGTISREDAMKGINGFIDKHSEEFGSLLSGRGVEKGDLEVPGE